MTAVQALLPDGGSLVLQGDREAGLSQAATLTEDELVRGGYRVLRLSRVGDPWSAFEALVELWAQLQAEPTDHYSLTASTQVAGRSVPSLAMELANMLRYTSPPMALIIENFDRDGDRSYNYRRVFRPLAFQSQRPVVVTFDPTISPWPVGDLILELHDFSREEVRECLEQSPASWSRSREDLDDAMDLVFGDQNGPVATVRPLTAYTRLRAWWAG